MEYKMMQLALIIICCLLAMPNHVSFQASLSRWSVFWANMYLRREME